MYQVTRTFRRMDRQRSRWEEYDLSNAPITTLTALHGDVWVFLTYPILQGEERALRFDDVSNMINGVSPETTLQEWLSSLGNTTIPLTSELPTFEERCVTYAQAWHAGYEIQAVGRGASPDQLASKFTKEDLLITKEGVDPEYLRRHSMISVNGFFHLTEYGPGGVYVREGNTSIRHANDNQIGIHSFSQVGAVDFVPITEEMITGKDEDSPLWQGCYLTLPEDVDLSNKSVLLVVGGYLQVADRTYRRVGDRTWRLQLGRLSLVERYFSSRDYIDLSSLDFTEYEHNDTLIATSELMRDSTIRAYLTLPQSFVVLVETDNLFQEYVPVEYTRLPGRWFESTDQFKQYPLVGAYGKTIEYHPIEEGGITVINGTESISHNFDIHRRPWRKQHAIDGSRYPAKPFRHTEAFWRVLGTS